MKFAEQISKKKIIIYSNQYRNTCRFYNLKNLKNLDSYRLVLNLAGKMDLQRVSKRVAFSDLSIYCTWKSKNSQTHEILKIRRETINLRC